MRTATKVIMKGTFSLYRAAMRKTPFVSKSFSIVTSYLKSGTHVKDNGLLPLSLTIKPLSITIY